MAKQSENIRNLEIAAKQAVLYNDAIQDTADLQRELLLDQTKILQASEKRVQIAQTERDLSRELGELEKNKNKLSKTAYKNKFDSLNATKQILKQLKQENKSIQNIKAGLTGVNNTMKSLVDSAESFVSSLPGGKGIVKLFGIDKLSDAFTDSLNAAAGILFKGGSLGSAMAAFSKTLFGLINPFTIIAAIAAGLVAVFVNFEKKAKGVSEATGLTLQQSKALVEQSKAAAISSGLQLATSTDILEVQKATVKEFGIANMLTAEQAGNVAEIGKAFGIGAKAASEVTTEFMRMGMNGTDAANALQNVSAEALKAGVNVGTVTADIAANAKETAKFFGGNVKALQKAAIQAAKLGVSLLTMAKVSEKLLDFENSISSQFEFQALTGKMINMDAARELALRGDIAGATKSVLDQVGGIAEFDNMSFLARKKLAEATGMSVDELQKSLTIQSKLGDLTADQQAAMANMGLSATQIKNMSAEELKSRLAQQQSTDKLAAGFSALKDDLTKALLPAGELLVKVFSALVPVIKLAFLPITLAAKAFEMLVNFAKEFSGITTAIGIGTGLILANKKKTLIYQTAIKADAAIEQGITRAKLFLQQGINAEKIKESILSKGQIVKDMAGGAVVLAKAVARIFNSFGMIPFGIGIPLAIAAAGGLFAKFNKAKSTGDLGIDPNGGPIVASPREGALFQGTKNDGVSMSPSHGAGGGGGNVAAAIAQTNALLRELISMGTVIEMDGKLVGQVVRTADSYRRK